MTRPCVLSAVFPGGSGFSTIRHRHRDAGCHLERDQEAILCPLVQNRRELHRRGLGHREGGIKAEGKTLLTTHRYLVLMSDEGLGALINGWQKCGWLNWCFSRLNAFGSVPNLSLDWSLLYISSKSESISHEVWEGSQWNCDRLR